MNVRSKFRSDKIEKVFTEVFGLGRAAALSAILLILVFAAGGLYLFFYLAPPDTIVMTSGPKGSMYERYAERYAKILQRNGITLKILSSEGSVENIGRLADSSSKVDIGFVQGGVLKGVTTDNLVSLGSIAYEPLFIFYRSESGIDLLSQLAGWRVAVGEAGSGSHALSLALLAANGIEPGGATTLLEMDSDAAAKAILDGSMDAVFLMGDSVSTSLIRQLLRTPGIRLFSVAQADGYTRRISYLNKIILPRGAIDLGKDIPEHDVTLLAPTVELIARENLHPALSDLVLEAAREIHSGSGLLKGKGQFPAPIEQEIRISDDAYRFYQSGKSFLYKYLPFRLASLVNRIVVVIIPLIVLLLPGLHFITSVYRWRFRSRLIKWYRAMIDIEKDLLSQSGPDRHKELLARLDEIDRAVNKMKVPSFYADQFYGLRGHIGLVRERLASSSD